MRHSQTQKLPKNNLLYKTEVDITLQCLFILCHVDLLENPWLQCFNLLQQETSYIVPKHSLFVFSSKETTKIPVSVNWTIVTAAPYTAINKT